MRGVQSAWGEERGNPRVVSRQELAADSECRWPSAGKLPTFTIWRAPSTSGCRPQQGIRFILHFDFKPGGYVGLAMHNAAEVFVQGE
jgi:hypothetical protein